MVFVQDMENKIRQTLNEIYFGKTRDIVNDLRYMYISSALPVMRNYNRFISEIYVAWFTI